MHRRYFIKNISLAGGALAISGNSGLSAFIDNSANDLLQQQEPWFDKAMRWDQVAFVENNPENKESMTVHLVNLTNPMMLKGPFREIYPII